MDALRRFFSNFQNHITISRTTDGRAKTLTKKAFVLANEAKSEIETQDNDLATNKQDNNSNVDVEVPRDTQETIKYTNVKKPEDITNNTEKYLQEFDEILEEMNKDIIEEDVSLDDINDVINNITAEEDCYQLEICSEPLFEIPRFDLQDLIHNSLNIENCANIESIDLEEIDEPNEDNLCVNSQTSANTDYYNDYINEEEFDVISISSDESQVIEPEVNKEKNEEPKNMNNDNKEPINVNIEPENVNNENKTITDEPINVNNAIEWTNAKHQGVFIDCESKDREKNEPKNVNVKNNEFKNVNNENEVSSAKSDEIFISKLENTLKDELENVLVQNNVINDEPKNVNIENDDTKSIDVVNLDEYFNDSEPIASAEPENLNEELNNVNNEPNNVNTENYSSVISQDDSDDDYRSSDFEFITENEAKMFGIINNDGIVLLKKRTNESKRGVFETDMAFPAHNDIHPLLSSPNMQNRSDLFQKSNFKLDNSYLGLGINTSDVIPRSSNQNRSSLRYVRRNPRSITINNLTNLQKDANAMNVGFNSYLQENCSISNNVHFPNDRRRNYSSTLVHHGINRWRAFPYRDENQYADVNIENHRILDGEEYHRLFDPHFGPQPHQRLRLMENKSIMSRNTMLMGFNGVGFDMQMLREWNEDNEVKNEAEENALKILEMYPEENERKRRRF